MKKHFRIKIDQSILDDLKNRIAATRWTDEIENSKWEYGTNKAYLKELCNYWQNDYDWREQEAKLNEFAWFTADIDGNEINFIHEPGKGPNPTPLILFHGWPDSVMRYTKLIPMLTDPVKFGGNPDQSFDVIVPSLIGYKGKAKGARQQAFKQVAELNWRLMTEELGYKKFGAVGGDGGSPLSQLIGVHHPESIIGLHLTDLGFHATMGENKDLTEAEQKYMQEIGQNSFREGAYAMQMGTKPQTLAYALNDSPVGMAAWIVEKIHSWSDCDGDIEKRYTKDEILTNIMQYWLAGPSVLAFSYAEEFASPSLRPNQEVTVPVAIANPPKDLAPIPPREFAERNMKNLKRWTVLAHGGHFVAMEFPELMAEDIRAFFKELKDQTT
jgi:pimeloyl-ACP methyl ester carboxylesterase